MYDWVFVFRDLKNNQYTVIHNDVLDLETYMKQDDIVLCGFNNKHYDNWIIQAILLGYDTETIKEISDLLVDDHNGWELSHFQGKKRFNFNSFDLFDDMQMGMGLKTIEAHLGMNIVESEVDFNIERPLNHRELKETIEYCKNDVDATYEVFKLRKNYLQTKIDLGNQKNIAPEISLSCTNAKIVARYLGATRTIHNDGRDYIFPKELDYNYIPKELIAFYKQIHNKSIDDKDLFGRQIVINIGGLDCTFRWGGVHGSKTQFRFTSTETRVIQNRDVSSLYPSLAIQYGYMSRNCRDDNAFIDTYKTRINAKHIGDKKVAKLLKLPLNTYTGAMENQFNELYDPIKPRSIRITGQLAMCELAFKLANIPTLELINVNTDGLMYIVDKIYISEVDKICAEWEKRVRLELETDEIKKVFIKSVNDLFIEHSDGSIKTVGGYLNYGITEKGAWAINNNYVCCKKALYNYFLTGKPIEESINENNNIFDFQIIAKAGAMYKESSYYIGGERQVIQKVNRCYATNNISYGTIKKSKSKNKDDKIGNLPDHVLIDNDNHLTIADVYKGWYIDKAKKMLGDFLGTDKTKVRELLNNIAKII